MRYSSTRPTNIAHMKIQMKTVRKISKFSIYKQISYAAKYKQSRFSKSPGIALFLSLFYLQF